ncbi:hypothetical protein [Paenibacillus sp. XY044]|uniref:hypothetical protein n=1 Tax=Paenibacillus sp. XY044 TaxID=2026089 RepID=UPI000B98C094|nr:hypothetical protein [Paenibacillus sp. XY044]OZB90799.1 hypothetical protein CJP46_30740 [Paenibacillus sp. XY044]
MEWLERYEADLSYVFRETENMIASFPSPLNTKGLSYLSHFNVLQENSAKNYICYLLPFWLMETARLSGEDARKLSIGNVCAMLYFFIQDDCIDSSSPQDKEQLPLGNLLYLQFLDIYRGYFPSDSPFWSYFRQYLHEWAESVSNEQTADYFRVNPLFIARKAAPLKLSSTGALLLSGRDERIPAVTDLVEHVLATLQMADDWADWREDLEEGSYNSLLSLIRSQFATAETLSPERVEHYIAVRGILRSYTAVAEANHEHIKQIPLNIPHLISFHEHILLSIQEDANRIEEERNALQKGGLSLWLLNHIK